MNILSDPKNGGQTQTNSSQKPPNFSSGDLGISELSEKWLTEHWLLAAGVVPDSAADTLLLYAYSQKGVQNVELVIDRDDPNNGKNPSVTYKLDLEVFALLKWKMAERINRIKNTILRKLTLLFWFKLSAPIFIKESIVSAAKEYLPMQYQIKVELK